MAKSNIFTVKLYTDIKSTNFNVKRCKNFCVYVKLPQNNIIFWILLPILQ
jgi:hypothetical protein